MPQQRRLPKFGFTSRTAQFNAEVRLSELVKVSGDVIDAQSLKAARVVDRRAVSIKIIASGSVDKAFNIKGIKVTKGARVALEAAGGSIAE
jgi:large subunit ribosomal protein L15